jgi:hypothetical protein
LATAEGLKKQKIFSVFQVIANRSVAAFKDHVPGLPLAEVAKDVIIRPAVGVAMLLTGCPSKHEYDRMLSRCADAALLLTTINLMDVPATVVDSVLIEVLPRHNQALS